MGSFSFEDAKRQTTLTPSHPKQFFFLFFFGNKSQFSDIMEVVIIHNNISSKLAMD
jgi:hypothetical protein